MNSANKALPRRTEAGDTHAAPASWRLRDIVLLLPKILLTALVVLAIANMVLGVFLRYVMVPITDYLNLPPLRFFWVEELGEYSLAWLTMLGAGVGLAERAHFTLRLLTHHLPLPLQRIIHIVNHAIIITFGLLTAWYGGRLAETNITLISPGLQISLAWLYASAMVGGVLIALYGFAMAIIEYREIGHESGDEIGAITGAGD
jgi:TRAP-type C4-dicarboxylate transport system permease small subunit